MRRQGLNWEALIERVANHYKVEGDSLRDGRKERGSVRARSVVCYLAVRKFRMSATEVALKLNITPSAVSKLVTRGQSFVPTGADEELLMEN